MSPLPILTVLFLATTKLTKKTKKRSFLSTALQAPGCWGHSCSRLTLKLLPTCPMPFPRVVCLLPTDRMEPCSGHCHLRLRYQLSWKCPTLPANVNKNHRHLLSRRLYYGSLVEPVDYFTQLLEVLCPQTVGAPNAAWPLLKCFPSGVFSCLPEIKMSLLHKLLLQVGSLKEEYQSGFWWTSRGLLDLCLYFSFGKSACVSSELLICVFG